MMFKHLMALSFALPAALCAAQDQQPPRTPAEPEVKQIVVEDEGSRIEELRVRGETKNITVTTKQGGAKSRYHIITGDGSRELTSGHGATGKSVWSVFSF